MKKRCQMQDWDWSMVLKAKSVESRWILDYLWLDPAESRPIKEIEFVTTSPVLKPDKIFGIPIFVAAAGVERLPILIWKLRRSTIPFFILPLPARPDLPTYLYGTLEKQKKIVKNKRRNQTPRNFLRQAEAEEGWAVVETIWTHHIALRPTTLHRKSL